MKTVLSLDMDIIDGVASTYAALEAIHK